MFWLLLLLIFNYYKRRLYYKLSYVINCIINCIINSLLNSESFYTHKTNVDAIIIIYKLYEQVIYVSSVYIYSNPISIIHDPFMLKVTHRWHWPDSDILWVTRDDPYILHIFSFISFHYYLFVFGNISELQAHNKNWNKFKFFTVYNVVKILIN